MTPAGRLEIGSSYTQWSPARWCPLPGKADTEILPKFTPGSLDHQLGMLMPICGPAGEQSGQALIEGYRCADDGSGVWMRFRIISLEGDPHEQE